MEFVDQTYIDFNEVTVKEQEEKEEIDDPCPVCGKRIYRSGRCKTCLCGWSSCDL
jgi:hypothetical protein